MRPIATCHAALPPGPLLTLASSVATLAEPRAFTKRVAPVSQALSVFDAGWLGRLRGPVSLPAHVVRLAVAVSVVTSPAPLDVACTLLHVDTSTVSAGPRLFAQRGGAFGPWGCAAGLIERLRSRLRHDLQPALFVSHRCDSVHPTRRGSDTSRCARDGRRSFGSAVAHLAGCGLGSLACGTSAAAAAPA